MQNWASVFWNHDLFLDNHDRLPCKMNIFKCQLMRQYSKATWVLFAGPRKGSWGPGKNFFVGPFLSIF